MGNRKVIKMIDFIKNADIPQAVYKKIDMEIKDVMGKYILGRKLFPVNVTNEGLSKKAIETIKASGLDAAEIVSDPSELSKTFMDLESTITPTAVVGTRFYIKPTDLTKGFDTMTLKLAGKQVASAEDTLIMNGSTKYGITGLYDLAGNTVATSYDFGTAGNAVDAVVDAKGQALADGIDEANWHLILPQTQFDQLYHNYIDNRREIEDVQKLLGTGKIKMSKDLTPGTGLMVPVSGSAYFDIYVPQDVVTILAKDDIGGINGYVFEQLTPRAWQTNALIKLTGI